MDNIPKPVLTLSRDSTSGVSAACFLQKGDRTYLVCGGSDNSLYIWDLNVNRIIYQQSVTDVIISIHHHEKTAEKFEIITQEKNGTVIFYCFQKNLQLLPHHSFHCGMTYCRLIIVDDSIVFPQEDGSVKAMNLHTESITTLQLFEKPTGNTLGYIMAIVDIIINTKRFLLGGYESGHLILWDFETGIICARNRIRENITSIFYDKATGRIVVGNSSHILELFRVEEDLKIHVQCELSITNPGCALVKIRPKGPLLISAGWDSRVRIFSWKSLKPLAVLTEHSQSISDIAFSPGQVERWKAHLIAVASADGSITLWDLY